MSIDTPELYIGCEGCVKQNTVYCNDQDSLSLATHSLYDAGIPYHYTQFKGLSEGGSDGNCMSTPESGVCPKSGAIARVLLEFANNDQLIVER